MTTDNLPVVACQSCGMPCTAVEYHPFAACLMFNACHNSETVRANLSAVGDHCAQAAIAALQEQVRALTADRDGWAQQASDRVDDAVRFAREADELKAAAPMQPVVIVEGEARFKENRIVSAVLDHATPRGYGMNEIARGHFTDEERMQFAQLIGYSLDGYGELSYVTDESYSAARGKEPAA